VEVHEELSQAHVVRAWLESEWPTVDAQARWLVGPHADLASPVENEQRLALLRDRQHMLARIPDDATYRRATVEEGDIAALFVVPDPGWYMDTGGTFALARAPFHVRPGRRPPIPWVVTGHCEKIDGIREHLAKNPQDGGLLLLLSGGDAPFTILDGNHRAVALLQLHRQGTRTLPWSAILISSRNMRNVPQHIDSAAARRGIRMWRAWASAGLLR
jgi:hypothetical protein